MLGFASPIACVAAVGLAGAVCVDALSMRVAAPRASARSFVAQSGTTERSAVTPPTMLPLGFVARGVPDAQVGSKPKFSTK
jgi:hypothetical protein